MRMKTTLCQLLGIEYPIVAAPMGPDLTGPALVAAVSGQQGIARPPALQAEGALGVRPLVAHCHLGLGKLYRRTGQREQAHEHLTTATTMYREMGMTYWLEK